MPITTDPNFLSSELYRLENNLLSYLPERQWEIVTATFPSDVSSPIDVRYRRLTPSDPTKVDVRVLQSNAPGLVWPDWSKPQRGLVKLWATTPSVGVVLLLSATEDAEGRDTPPPSPTNILVGKNQNQPLLGFNGASVGLIGSSTMANDSFVGPGVDFYDASYRWQLGLHHNGADESLRFRNGGNVPLMVRKFSGDYFVQPGPQTNTGANIYLGNPNDSASGGIWDGIYAAKWYRASGGAAQGAWQNYSPTVKFGTNAVSIGNGSITGKYAQIDNTTLFRVVIAIGSSTTFPTSGNLSVSLPNTAVGGGLQGHFGEVLLVDSSASALYPNNLAVLNTSTEIVVYRSGSPSPGTLTNTLPVTLASGDSITLTGFYENA